MKINNEFVLNEIREMLCETYPGVDVSMETYLEFGDGTYLDMSSIEIVQFLVDLENKFDIIIDIEDRFYTVGDVVKGVTDYLLEKAPNTQEDTCGTKL